MEPILVKICGITRAEDAIAAADAGADFIGLNFWPGSPRCIALDRAAEIVEAVSGRIEPVALFVDPARDDVLRIAATLSIRTVQVHGETVPGDLGGLRVIRAVPVSTVADIASLARTTAFAFLLDARVPGMRGGTGQTFDWDIARDARRFGRILLAGGLTPENVAQAVRVAEPWGVDCASGVELLPGIKDHDKIRRFVHNARHPNEGNT